MPPACEFVLNYVYNLVAGFSRLFNAVIGGDPAETLSSRLGKSVVAGGWASHAPLPWWLRAHFVACIDWSVGRNTVVGRRLRY